jgi:hypothetical protein
LQTRLRDALPKRFGSRTKLWADTHLCPTEHSDTLDISHSASVVGEAYPTDNLFGRNLWRSLS